MPLLKCCRHCCNTHSVFGATTNAKLVATTHKGRFRCATVFFVKETSAAAYATKLMGGDGIAIGAKLIKMQNKFASCLNSIDMKVGSWRQLPCELNELAQGLDTSEFVVDPLHTN